MDTDTIILMGLLVTALSWWLGILIHEERQLLEQCRKNEIDKRQRADRIKLLTRKKQ